MRFQSTIPPPCDLSKCYRYRRCPSFSASQADTLRPLLSLRRQRRHQRGAVTNDSTSPPPMLLQHLHSMHLLHASMASCLSCLRLLLTPPPPPPHPPPRQLLWLPGAALLLLLLPPTASACCRCVRRATPPPAARLASAPPRQAQVHGAMVGPSPAEGEALRTAVRHSLKFRSGWPSLVHPLPVRPIASLPSRMTSERLRCDAELPAPTGRPRPDPGHRHHPRAARAADRSAAGPSSLNPSA